MPGLPEGNPNKKAGEANQLGGTKSSLSFRLSRYDFNAYRHLLGSKQRVSAIQVFLPFN